MSERSSGGLLLDSRQMVLLRPVSRLHATPPFVPAWEELVRSALRDRYVPEDGVGCSPAGVPSKNLQRLEPLVARAVTATVQKLQSGVSGTAEELAVYQGAAIWALWDEFGPRIQGLINAKEVEIPFYDDFVKSHAFFFGYPGIAVPEPAHMLGLFHQARRAWFFIWSTIRGGSPSVQSACAAIWSASLGGGICVYAKSLYRRMDRIPVLITGETGTGKELAARSIGKSRYVPVDAKARRLVALYDADLHTRNFSESPRELIASELFGHKKGSFTGALNDATGCFALPKEHGTLFIDEVGELPEHVQCMLLRPLENYEILPIGEKRPLPISGRPVLGTNKDLEAMCDAGTFRRDLYERMNGARVHMPPLRQMLAEAPDELRHYVRVFVEELLDDPALVEESIERVMREIDATRQGYAWPGNLRELKKFTERCMLTAEDAAVPGAEVGGGPLPNPRPPALGAPGTPKSTGVVSSGLLGRTAKAGETSIEELTRDLVTRVYVLCGLNITETARRLKINYRTVVKYLDRERLRRWLGKDPGEPDGE